MSLAALGGLLEGSPAYRRLTQALESARGRARAQVLANATPYVLANLWHSRGVSVLIVTPRPEDARSLHEQMLLWTDRDADVLHFPEHLEDGLETFKVGAVLLWGSENPDTVVDIGGTIELKLRALAAHASQLSTDPARIEGFVKRRAQDAGERASVDGHRVEFAEVFRKISFRR